MKKIILSAVAILALSSAVAMANERGENFGAVEQPVVKAKTYTAEELRKFKLPKDIDKFYLGE